ncbi:MAG: PAS domain S-box protein [Phycisphaerales bacterium]|nr:PAS domain S-box protein [Phycisphaerales bacterium]
MSGSVTESRRRAAAESARESAPALRLAFTLALVAMAYFAGAMIGKSLRFPSSHLSLLWPPTAIVLSALLLTPTRRWWLILFAAAPVHFAVQLNDGVPLLGVLSQLLGNFGQALLAATGIRLCDPGAIKFDSLRRTAVFAGAALVAPAVASLLIVHLYVLSGWEQDYWYAARARFLSNVLSTLTIVPPIVLAASGGLARAGRAPLWRLIESALLIAALGVIGRFAFGQLDTDSSGHHLALLYAPLPPLLWASVRFGVGGLCASMLLTAFMAFLSVGTGQGPFSTNSAAESALALQAFLIVVALPLLALAGLVEERRQDHQSLRDSQRRYHLASAAGNVGLWDWNLATGDIYVDPFLKATLGFEDHEIPNRIDEWTRRIHPDDLDRVTTDAQSHIRGQTEAYEIEHRVVCKDGSVRWFLARGSVVEWADGSAVRMVGTDTDITDRKLADAALRQSEARYRAVVEDQTELICRFLADGTYTFVNDAYCRYFQRSPEELIGETFWQFVPPEYREPGSKHLRSITADRPVASIEHEVVAPGGEIRWQQWTDRGFFDADGRIIEYQAVGRDITERKRAEAALRENEERLALATDAAQLGLWDWDLTTGAATWSDHMRRMYGRDGVSSEAPLESFLEMIHSDDRAHVRRAIEESIERPVPYEAEYRVVLPDGSVRWILAKGQTFFDANGKAVRRAGANRDITERKRAEQAIRESEDQLRMFVEHTPAAVAMFDRDMKYIVYSRRWLIDYKLGEQDLIGRSHYEVFPEVPDRWKEIHQRCLDGAIEMHDEDPFHRLDGTTDWIRWEVRPWRHAGGDIGGIIMFTEVVTARKRADEARRRFEQRFRMMADQVPVHIWAEDEHGRGVFVNARFVEYVGMSAEDLLKNWPDIIHPEDAQSHLQRYRTAATQIAEFHSQCRLRRRDGEYHWFDVIGMPHFEGDRFVGYVGCSIDITERKRAEEERRLLEAEKLAGEALRESRARLDAALRASGTGTFRWDVRTNAYDPDESLCRLLGLPAGTTLRAKPELWQMVHPEDREDVIAACRKTATEGGEFEKDFRVVRPDGSVSWLADKGWTFLDRDGKPAYSNGACVDITARKQAEEALKASETRYRRLIEDVRIIAWEFDSPSKRFAFVSHQAEEIMGYPIADWYEPGFWFRHLHPEDRVAAKEYCNRRSAAGEDHEQEYRMIRADGSAVWMRDMTTIIMRDGAPVGMHGVFIDITERKNAEEALRLADRRKDEFLAMLAHELRNPLAPIGLAVEVLRRSPETGESLAWARDVISRQVAQLTRLVDDLLDVSRITRGKIRLSISPIDLGRVIAHAVETSRPLIVARHHELSIDVPNQPLPVQGDIVRLAQVVSNLLNNAAKYTDAGGRIALSARNVDAQVVLKVADNGMGIPAHMLERVFEMFTQLAPPDSPSDRSHDGLGIGLTLVKRLVEMHGGTIEAQSEGPGKGSEFIVRLPLAIDQPTDHLIDQEGNEGQALASDRGDRAAKHELEHKRILIVDDNVDAAESLSRMLRLMEHEVHVAHDGLAALKAAERVKPDIVLLDIGLPKLDGLEVARRLRHQTDGPPPLLVATTGFGQAEDRRRIAAAGFDHHLIKPLDPNVLQSLVRTGKPQ